MASLKNARDVSNIGHWGTVDVEVTRTSMQDLDEIKQLLAAADAGRLLR